jgi:hypothetical protein
MRDESRRDGYISCPGELKVVNFIPDDDRWHDGRRSERARQLLTNYIPTLSAITVRARQLKREVGLEIARLAASSTFKTSSCKPIIRIYCKTQLLAAWGDGIRSPLCFDAIAARKARTCSAISLRV